MSSNAIQYSDALQFLDTPSSGICVKSKCRLKEGDLIATIPKNACLTIRTSGAAQMIESADFDGCLGLCVAIMYERSLGLKSPWYGYLQILPEFELLPLFGVWMRLMVFFVALSFIRQTVKDDKALIYEDWKECILPLIHSEEFSVDPNFFGVEDYFAAKSLVASRSFQIDDYHGSGMVPLADLFNHKTGAEDVHFTLNESDDIAESDSDDENDSSIESETQTSQLEVNGSLDDSLGASVVPSSSDGPHLESDNTPDNPLVLEMILVKDVEAGAEVFNTYGIVGNAALLHRYGFTEQDNAYDIVNIDLELVLQWSSSLFSGRHSRARLSLWRKLGYSACESQNSEYFEISYDGEPQLELLILLYIILLSEDNYYYLDLTLASKGNSTESVIADMSVEGKILQGELCELNHDLLLTKSVCKALISLADIREHLYGTSSLAHDLERLRNCHCTIERKLYHSLVLRVSERRVIQKLRTYAEAGINSLSKALRTHAKRLKS